MYNKLDYQMGLTLVLKLCTRTTNGLEGAKHAAAATNIAVPIISLDDAQKEFNYYQEVFGSLIEAPNE